MSPALSFPEFNGDPALAVGDRIRVTAERDMGNGEVEISHKVEGVITAIDADANCFWLNGQVFFAEEVEWLQILARADAPDRIA